MTGSPSRYRWQPASGMSSRQQRYVLPESVTLVLIGGADLLTTIYLLATHGAQEANPLFAGMLRLGGPAAFILLKAVMLAVPLTIAELAREKHAEFVRRALRVCIVAYVALYITAYVRNNVDKPPVRDNPISVSSIK